MRIQEVLSQVNRSLNLISDQVGIIHQIGKAALLNSDPNIVAYAAFNCETQALAGKPYSGQSGGCGFEWENAFLSSIGEGVERYCPVFYNINKLIKSCYSDFNENKAIHPNKFALFHEKQYSKKGFPFVKFKEDTIVYWSKAFNLIEKKHIYCPASFIYMPFWEDENSISEQISTGYGAHSTYNKALLNAIFEVIERDAFMISWMNFLDVPKIKIEGNLKTFVDSILPSHFTLHLFDMTTDIKVPSVFGILTGKHDFGDFIAFSAATRMTYKEAIKKTILELCQSVPYFRFLLIEKEKKEFKKFEDLKSFQDHSVFYTKRKDLWYTFDKWLDKKSDMSINFLEEDHWSDEDKIESIKDKFSEKGYTILVKDITTQDIMKSGFKVIRVVCPELIHLNGSYGFYYLGGKRLYKAPEKMGYKKKTYDELNFMPHPFP